MKPADLFSYINSPNDSLPVSTDDTEINLRLFHEHIDEKVVLERLAKRRNLSVQTVKILYNLYFNSIFKKVTTSDKQTIIISPYYKFYKIK